MLGRQIGRPRRPRWFPRGSVLGILGLAAVLLLAGLANGTERSLPTAQSIPSTASPVLPPGHSHPLVGPAILVRPTSGDVGATLAASGTGFTPNATIRLSYAGEAVATTCSTDASGSFPPTTGPNCTFTVPATPGGNESVAAWDGGTPAPGVPVGTDPSNIVFDSNKSELFVVNTGSDNVTVLSASTYGVVATIAVGSSPEAAVYDPTYGEIFVVNVASDDVSVISDSNNTVVATVPVGSTPEGIVYDGGRAEVFVANSNSDNVSVISGRSNALLATVAVGTSPYGVAYDYGTGEVFVTNSGSSNVSVILDSNNTVVATVPVGASPYLGAVYDPVAGEVFVPNFGSDNVSVVSDVTNAVVATIAVGAGPYGIAYDRSRGELFVSNFNSANVTVLSDTTNSAVATIAVGSGPYYGLAYDTRTGQMFVANSLSHNVSVIDDTTNAVVATLAVGSTPESVVYDLSQRTIVVANHQSKNLTVLSAGNAASASFHENSTLSIVPSNGTVGSKVAAAGSGFPASSAVGFSFSGIAVSSKCSTDATGTFPGTSGTACTFLVPSNAQVSNRVVATGGSDTASALFDVASELSVSPTNGPVGGLVAITGVRFAPNASITFSFGGSATVSSCSANATGAFSGATLSGCGFRVPASPKGPQTISATDGVHVATVSFTVNSNLTVSPTSGTTGTLATATGTGFAANSTITFSVDNVARTANCTSDPTGSFPGTSGTACTFSVPPVPGGLESVVATDGTNHTAVNFAVNSSLALLNSTGSADVAQKLTLQGNGYGDALDIVTFALGSLAINCTAATTGTCSNGLLTTSPSGVVVATFLVPAVAASGTYDLSVTDSAGHTGSVAIMVYVDPDVATPTPSTGSIDLGQSVAFTTLASFGTGSYTYDWRGLPDGCSGNTSSILCTPNATGSNTITVKVTDTGGYSVTSGGLRYTVYPDPIVTIPVASPGSGLADGGQNVTFSTTATFGTRNYTSYSWTGLPDGCAGATASVLCGGTALPAGSYSILVSVTDSNNFTATAAANLSYVVDSDLLVTPLAATTGSADVGQNVTFSTTAMQGSDVYTYTWTGLPTGCTGTTSAVVACNLTAPGPFTVGVVVRDSNGEILSAGSQALMVYADPTLHLQADRDSVDALQTVTLTAGASLGTGTYLYEWAGLPIGCSGANGTVVCVPTIAGGYPVSVQITDSNGVSAVSSTVILVVSPILSADISLTPSVATPGQPLTFTSTVHGGTGRVTYDWNFGDGNSTGGASAVHVYSAPGAYAVWLWVNDTGGGSVQVFLNLTILTPTGSAPPAVAALGPFTLALTLIIAAAVIIVLAAVLLAGRRKSTPPREPRASENPPDSSEWGTLPE
jgi:YVTN family beta-propeller protein